MARLARSLDMAADRRARNGNRPHADRFRRGGFGSQDARRRLRRRTRHARHHGHPVWGPDREADSVLVEWVALPTALVIRPADAPLMLRSALLLMAVGVFVSGVRDLYAAYELPHGAWPW